MTTNRHIAFRPSQISKSIRHLVLHFDPSDLRTPLNLTTAAIEFLRLAKVYYLISAFFIVSRRFDPLHNSTPTDNLWPIDLVTDLTGTYVLDNMSTTVAFGASTSALLAVFFPRILIWRLGVFLYFFYIDALLNSFGFPGYATRINVFISFTLLFLPFMDDGRNVSRKNVLACLAVFWFTQSLLLATYVISGFWKIWDSGMEIFAVDGLTRIFISRALSDTLNIPLLLPVIAPHVNLTHLIHLTIIYVEMTAIFVVFRPHLHRPYGVVLVLFHFGTDWILNVRFPINILVVGLFLVLSPTAPKRFSLIGFIQSLPVIGIPFRAWMRLRLSDCQQRIEQALLIYSGRGPVINRYARRLITNETIGELILINAREDREKTVTELVSLLDKSNGTLILRMDERIYTGSKAIRKLALRTKGKGVSDIISRIALSAPLGASIYHTLLRLENLVVKK